MPSTSKLDLNLLAVLVALHETGSASEAAVRLGMGQSSVSGALARLRAHFDDPLFVRSAGGMAPTPRGEEVAATAADVLQQVATRLAPQQAFDPERSHRPFTFALSDVGEMVFLPPLLRHLREVSPQTPVRSVSLKPAALADALQAGDVDLAIGYFPDLQSAQFFQQLLLKHHFVGLLRHGHPVSGSRLSMSEYLALEHAVVHSEGRSQEILEAYLQSRGLTRRIALVTPHFLSIPSVIARSDLVVAVPHAIGVAYGKPVHGLKSVELPFESPRIELRQHWHRRVHHDARNRWLRGVVRALFSVETDEWGREFKPPPAAGERVGAFPGPRGSA